MKILRPHLEAWAGCLAASVILILVVAAALALASWIQRGLGQ